MLEVKVSDGQLFSTDTLAITVIPRNQPPTVEAGPDQEIELPNSATLNGSVSDDALPRGSTLTVNWSVVSGPGNVTFADANATTTTATFSAPGSYILKLTANDTELRSKINSRSRSIRRISRRQPTRAKIKPSVCPMPRLCMVL